MSNQLEPAIKENLFEYLLRLGDDMLVLGQRLSEWCGHGPILEEDIAMTNIALDHVGQAEMILRLAGEVEGKGRSENDLAYFRDETEYRNALLLEQPRGHFGDTMARQFLFDAFAWLLYEELKSSSYQPLADIAAKAHKEITYHLRHSRQWVLRLGAGTEESHGRINQSFQDLWPLTGELFFSNHVDQALVEAGMAPALEPLRLKWRELVTSTLAEATLPVPNDPPFWAEGARVGQHSEHLGHMLATMQILPRSHPDAEW